jgi:hypothetical protein
VEAIETTTFREHVYRAIAVREPGLPSKTFDVELRGMDVLRQRLDTRRILGPVKEEMIDESSKKGLETAIREFKGRAGTGGIARTVRRALEQDGLIARIDVPSAVARKALSIEEGRPPGKNVPYTPLTAWAGRAGMQTDRQSIRELRARIKGSGTPGLHAMEKAKDVAEHTLHSRQPQTERRIERDFNA